MTVIRRIVHMPGFVPPPGRPDPVVRAVIIGWDPPPERGPRRTLRQVAREAEAARVAAAGAALRAQVQRGFKPPTGRLWAADAAALLLIGPAGGISLSAAGCAALAPLAVGGRHPEPAELRTVLDGLAPRLAAVGLRVCRRKAGVRIAKAKPPAG